MISTILTAVSTDSKAADFLRDNDKFNVVFTVVITIFIVLIAFMVWIEKRLSQLEKKNKKNV